ncbi:MAG TPA: cytidylate kinase family protein [Rectinemataceae bacterium]|nr:cytidylate kinase family protein [Rectinemataceae bacterium]
MAGIIAISGKSGCGNSTVSGLVAAALGFDLVNFTFKNLAAERGMSFEEIIEKSKTDDSFDLEVDRRQVALARAGNRVVGSRLALWLLKKDADLRVYLWASPEVRAMRIRAREGMASHADPAFTRARDESDHNRYLRLYGYDNDDFTDADLVINTERFAPAAIASIIVDAWRHRDRHARESIGGR